MATLVLRTVKGSPLTNAEVDGNFSNINSELGYVGSNVGVLSNLTTTAKSNLVAAINEIAAESTSNVTITAGNISNVAISGTVITNSTYQGNVIDILYGGTGASSASGARTSLGVAIGSNVQAWSANLDAIAALSRADGNFIVGNGSTWVVENDSTARTSLGLGTIATQAANNVAITGGNITNLTSLTGTTATFSGTIAAQDFNSTSDITLKDNIVSITNPLNILSQLQPKEFVWKSNGNKAYGLIAQDVEKILPNIVANNGDVKGINYINIIAFLVSAVNELSAEIKQLKNK